MKFNNNEEGVMYIAIIMIVGWVVINEALKMLEYINS